MFKRTAFLCVIVLLLTTVSFADKPSNWAEESISKLQMSDVFDSEFYDGFKTSMTRKEFAYLSVKLYEELSGIETTVGEDPFKDTDDEWVLRGYNEGFIKGYDESTYGPNDLITREQLAVLLMRVIKASGVEYDNNIADLKFSDDNEISPWAKESVYLANKNGILNGVGDNRVSPKTDATKEQAMIMSLRIVDNSTVTNNIDNSISNDLNISDNEDSNISVSIDNTDNSVTDSNNVYYDYSTVINNYIDNSVTVNNTSAESLKEIIEALQDIDSGLENFSFYVFNNNNDPIAGAVLYVDNTVKGVSDENGLILVDVSDFTGEQNIIIRKTGYRQFYSTLTLDKDEKLNVIMEDAVDKIDSIAIDENKEVYEAFISENEDYFEVTVYGEFFSDYRDDVEFSNFQIVDQATNQNLVKNWSKRSYGSNSGTYFTSFEVLLANGGLDSNGDYKIIIERNGDQISTKLTATSKPIINRVSTREISIIGNYAYITYRLNDRKDTLDEPLVLVNKDGDVIFQEVNKFSIEYSNLVYFELVNKKALENSRYLYVRGAIDDSIIFAMEKFHKMETVYDPIILVQDYGATSRTNNNYVDETVIGFYGYNLVGETFKGNLEIDGTTIVVADSVGEATYTENGFIEYLEFKFNRDDLETGEYTIDIEGLGGFGRYNIDK